MDDLRGRLERTLGTTYTIERELGGGGMSRTYLAMERALERRVVIKVLAPELLAGISIERFRREVLLAAQLQHPHVVPVLAAGDAEGLPWFTMPYVDGDSLRHRLAQGLLGIGELIGVLRDVARALTYAHKHGVVHRDIKPDNVLLSGGSATVTDFGIAKAITAARSAGMPAGATLTVAGTSIGTPTYMAPEQAAADPDADHRVDIYAFGVMAYELLAGHPPFHSLPPARVLAAHLSETPRDVRELRPDCPEPLASLVMQCLEKEPGDRPQQASDVARVLDSITSGTGATAAPAILRGGRMPMGKAVGVWAAATVIVAITAWAATEAIGLPDWVFPGSLGVMLAGLPVIGITAYVQRVVHKAYTTTPRFTPGGTPPLQSTMATLAIKASPHLSWRRTWLGGSLAVGGFAALVVGFMVMRALGIGPVGTLRGKGAFGARETIMVADFRGPASDSAIGPTVAEALRTDLAQSRSLNVLTRATVRDILGLMQRSAETVVLFPLAREIATREGAKAVLDGEVSQLGQSYVVAARLVSALDGSELATFRVTAASEDELIGAIGKLSRSVRERAGESLRTIRASSELERVTTPSLLALRKYVEGAMVADELGDAERGLALLQEAVTIDTAFAMAWRKISVILGNEGRERQRALDAVETAYRHRERLSEMERYLTEGYYYTRGPRPNRERALAAYEAAIQIDSTIVSAVNNAAVVHGQLRNDERAEELYRKVVRLPRTFGGAFTNLIQVQIRNGRSPATLDSTVAMYRERFPSSNDLWEAEWYSAWGKGELRRADSISRATFASARTLRQTERSAASSAALAELQGRPREGLQWRTRSSEALLRSADTPGNRLNFALDTAFGAALYYEDAARARAALQRGFARASITSIPPAERPWGPLARLAAIMRDPALAQQALEGYDRDESALVVDPQGRRAFFTAHVALASERWDDAIPLLHEADRRLSISNRYALMQLAHAHDLADRPDSAIAYFERYLATGDPNPGEDSQWRGGTFKRLGELYEASGNRDSAMAHYERFVQLWNDAEPELQPKVREVRAKLDQLRAAGGE